MENTLKKLIVTLNKEKLPRKDVQNILLCGEAVRSAAAEKGWSADILFITLEDFEKGHAHLKEKLLVSSPDCVFNLFEGFAADPHKEYEFAEIIESLGIPFTGNSSHTLKLSLDKYETKKILSRNSLPVPKGFKVKSLKDIRERRLELPFFIKPCFEDASLGIDEKSFLTKLEDLPAALTEKLKSHPEGLLVEEFLPGKEFNIGFLGGPDFELVGISVMDYNKHPDISPFMSYSSKWDTKTKEYKALVPVVTKEGDLDKAVRDKLFEICSKAAKILGCRSYFRIDLREKNEKFCILDVNPNPDISPDSGFIRQAFARGLTYADTIEKIINASLAAGKEPYGL
ncbi:MAG: ATP-grasp domain-containing protein [Candidatus Omnitrophica bacterium]|nr:ATP-grasp domain-containing protein [Candidatus Omnitrophota bacterium]